MTGSESGLANPLQAGPVFLFQIIDDLRQFRRQRAGKFQVLAGGRMDKAEQPGMQKLPVQLLQPGAQLRVGQALARPALP